MCREKFEEEEEEKFINGNNLRSPVQIDFESKNEGENIERVSSLINV